MTVEQFLQKHAVKLRANRGGWICCCLYPSHRDSTPSFHVSWEGLYFCWGCGKKGSFAALLHDIEKWSWPKAIEHTQRLSKSTAKPSLDYISWQAHEKIPTLSRGLLGLFDVNWEEGEARYAHEVASGQNVFFPPWSFPFQKGFESRTLRHFEAGYDDSMQRVTIPVIDTPLHKSVPELKGFIGRTCTDAFPKYYIYPPLRTAYHLYNLKAVKNHSYVALVEGPWDVWMFWQRGFPIPAVSLFTSKVFEPQAKILSALGRTYVLMFDADDAGRKGAQEVAQNLLARGLKIDIGMQFPAGVADVKKLSLKQLEDAFLTRRPYPAPSALSMLRSEPRIHR